MIALANKFERHSEQPQANIPMPVRSSAFDEIDLLARYIGNLVHIEYQSRIYRWNRIQNRFMWDSKILRDIERTVNRQLEEVVDVLHDFGAEFDATLHDIPEMSIFENVHEHYFANPIATVFMPKLRKLQDSTRWIRRHIPSMSTRDLLLDHTTQVEILRDRIRDASGPH